MLRKQLRLRTLRDFHQLHRKGKTTANRHLIAKYIVKPTQEFSRFAVVISNRTEKSAVKRNRAKRQLREVLRTEHHRLRGGYDVLVTIKTGFLPLSFDEMNKTVKDLLKKANLFA